MEEASKSAPLPVLVLPETVLFPRITMPLLLYEERELALLDALQAKTPQGQNPRLVLSMCQWDSPYPQEARPNPVGTLCEILEADKEGPERNILVRGLERIQLTETLQSEPYLLARAEPLSPGQWNRPAAGPRLSQLVEQLRERAQSMAFGGENPRGREILNTIQWIEDPGVLADYVAHYLVHDWYLKQEILEVTDPAERVQTVLEVLGGEGAL